VACFILPALCFPLPVFAFSLSFGLFLIDFLSPFELRLPFPSSCVFLLRFMRPLSPFSTSSTLAGVRKPPDIRVSFGLDGTFGILVLWPTSKARFFTWRSLAYLPTCLLAHSFYLLRLVLKLFDPLAIFQQKLQNLPYRLLYSQLFSLPVLDELFQRVLAHVLTSFREYLIPNIHQPNSTAVSSGALEPLTSGQRQ